MGNKLQNDEIRKAVRKNYGEIAKDRVQGCGCSSSSCCSDSSTTNTKAISELIGYSKEDLGSVPEGANLGLGCGNPKAIARLRSGETVLDLGSGAGFDCFLAAKQVGQTGRVIGIDMTHEMLTKARANATKDGFDNVEFRLGEIEHLPVANSSVDVIISNCVINLSPEKPSVFQEAYRVLKPGGRLAISDIVATAPLPKEIRDDIALYSGCVSGASTIEEHERILTEIGFANIRIKPNDESRKVISEWIPGRKIEDYVVSATIEAVKP
jgi:SAM-dependent methyltransferase